MGEKEPKPFRCDDVKGEKFFTQTDDIGGGNTWFDIFCFPYILGSKFWDCCMQMCEGGNQLLVYMMLLQYCLCKIRRAASPSPMFYPYYFYMVLQVVIITATFITIWLLWGRSVIIPFFQAFYYAMTADYSDMGIIPPRKKKSKPNASRLTFKKYCFKKGDIFDTQVDRSMSPIVVPPTTIVTFVSQLLVNQFI